jgi:hypothetical protein
MLLYLGAILSIHIPNVESSFSSVSMVMEEDEPMEEFYVSPNGTSSSQCGRINERACQTVWLAMNQITGSSSRINVEPGYYLSLPDTNLALSLTPINITIRCSSINNNTNPSSWCATINMSSPPFDVAQSGWQFVGPFHLTLERLRIISSSTGYGYGALSMSSSSSSPSTHIDAIHLPRLTIRDCIFEGHELTRIHEGPTVQSVGAVLNLNQIHQLIIERTLFTSNFISLYIHDAIPCAIVMVTLHDGGLILMTNVSFINGISRRDPASSAITINNAATVIMNDVTISNNHVAFFVNDNVGSRSVIGGACLITSMSRDIITNKSSIVIQRLLASNNSIVVEVGYPSVIAIGGPTLTIVDHNTIDIIQISDSLITLNHVDVGHWASTICNTYSSAIALVIPYQFNSSTSTSSSSSMPPLPRIENGVAGNIVIERCSFTMNTMMGGINASGALFIHSGESLSIHDSHFSDNEIITNSQGSLITGAGLSVICMYLLSLLTTYSLMVSDACMCCLTISGLCTKGMRGGELLSDLIDNQCSLDMTRTIFIRNQIFVRFVPKPESQGLISGRYTFQAPAHAEKGR